MQAMQGPHNDPRIMFSVCSFLLGMARFDVTGHDLVIASGGLAVAQAAKIYHAEDVDIQAIADRLLTVLT